MPKYDWNKDKSKLLKKTRGISFEEVVKAIKSRQVITDLSHPNKERYPNQRMFVININKYIYVVPYVIDNNKYFLKTIYPNRKLNKQYKEANK